MLKILVADDERPARSELVFLLSSILPADTEFVQAENANVAMEKLSQTLFDICFLDIEMGDIKGTTLAAVIHDKQPQAAVVFVTAYQHYAAEAFDLDAVDYVMKPYDLSRIKKTLDRLKNRHYFDEKADGEQTAPVHEKAQMQEKEEHRGEKIALNAGNKICLVSQADILYIEAIRHGSRIVTPTEAYEETIPLNVWEKKLDDANFFRIHKSYLVNLRHAKELVPDYNNGYALCMEGKDVPPIPISRNKIKEMRERFTIK